MREITGRRPSGIEIGPDEDAGAEAGIETVFRRKLAGLKALRRSERPHALRAAREERQAALKALRDRRAWVRHARCLLKRLVKPMPQ